MTVLRRSGRVARRALLLIASATLAACATAPAYRKPALDLPALWQAEAPFGPARPQDANAKGPWWLAFADPVLDALEAQALAQSPTLAIAAARLTQARSQAALADANTQPTVAASAGAARQKTSANRPLSNYNVPNVATVQNEYRLGAAVSWEADFSGRLQLAIEGARAGTEQAQADLENARLLLTADVAQAYFRLRALDDESQVVSGTLASQGRALAQVVARHELGAISGLDLAQQRSLQDVTRTQLELLQLQREQVLHALATLVGQAAPGFTLAARNPGATPGQPMALPLPAPGLPSDLLQRRPDVASAERAVAQAHVQIGLASSAYFPTVLLGTNGGWDSNGLSSLFDAKSLLWSFGVSASQTLFDGGRRQAGVDLARAGHVAAVERYRQTVLTAMQEVEDGLTGLSALQRASLQAATATASLQRVLTLATDRWTLGAASELEVITAQQALLTNQRLQVQLQGQRQQLTVFLFKALGGGF